MTRLNLDLFQGDQSITCINDISTTCFDDLYPEIINLIFSQLGSIDLAKSTQVSQLWLKVGCKDLLWDHVIENELLKLGFRNKVYGEVEWEKSLGKIGGSRYYPRNLCKFFASHSSFFAGQTVVQSSAALLLPEEVNNKPVESNSVGQLVKTFFKGDNESYILNAEDEALQNEMKKPNVKSRWIIITDRNISKSTNKSPKEQQELLQEYPDYREADFLETVTHVFMRRVVSEQYLFKNGSFTRCQLSDINEQVIVANMPKYAISISPYKTKKLQIGIQAVCELKSNAKAPALERPEICQ